MRRIYCISGLGADQRAFSNLSIPGYELVALPWVANDDGDDMRSYAAKIIRDIPDEQAVIIGLSLGGMLATEIAKTHPDWKIFIISSAKTSGELGFNSAFLRWISKRQIIPEKLFTLPSYFKLWLLGAYTAEEKKLISLMMKQRDAAFVRWCVNAILTWNNHSFTQNIIHIHGTADKVIRPVRVHPDHWITGGSHIMIYNRAAAVSKIISACLNAL